MNRRNLLRSAALASCGQLLRAQMPMYQAPQAVQINFPSIELATEIQLCPEWCWAASISSVFRYFNRNVDQRTIVIRKYGTLACAGSQSAAQIAAFLNTTWQDEVTKKWFQSTLTAAFDAMAHVGAINNAIIVNELANQRPVIYCNLSHCMVIVGVTYTPGPMGPNILTATVMDPFPTSQRFHLLSMPEMYPAQFDMYGRYVPGSGQMSFLGTVTVS